LRHSRLHKESERKSTTNKNIGLPVIKVAMKRIKTGEKYEFTELMKKSVVRNDVKSNS
jgi:hypothetical protein